MVGENPKALQTFTDLEVARCNERWNEIPELAKRYKKFHPYESVLEFTARMEAEFILSIRQARSQIIEKYFKRSSAYAFVNNAKVYQEEVDIFYQLDDPSNISLSPRIDPTQVQLILARLLDVIQRQIKSGELETPDDWQAQFSKIVLARIYFETGRYDKALEWLQNLALRLEDVESGYGLVLLVQARVIKGVCFEFQENYTEALESYFGALRVIEQHPEEQNRALFNWIEDCLYRSILLHLRRKGPVKQTLKLMRNYLHYCTTQWPNDWRIYKRWIIFRHYIRYLTKAYQRGVYVPSSPDDEYTTPMSPTLAPARSVFSDPGEATLFERSAAALEETIHLMRQYRNLLTVFAQQLHKKDPIDLNHRTLEYTNLLFSAHETIGWGTDQDYIRRVYKYLTRARKFTFNSVCITRHLFYTLVKLNEFNEAKIVLNQYFELIGVPHVLKQDNSVQEITRLSSNDDDSDGDDVDEDDFLEEIAERIQNKLDTIVHESQATANKNLLSIEKLFKGYFESKFNQDEQQEEEEEEGDIMPKKKPSTGSCESDMEFDVVKLVLMAIHQLYGNTITGLQGYEASTLSNLAVAILEESEHLKRKKGTMWKSLMIQSRRVKGSSYSLYASQCQDEKKRLGYMSEALTSYKRASELDSRSWQTFYELGLQQAILGDMLSAAASIKRSVKLRSDFIPSWHLLALIQSSRQFHALPKSLQIIQAGLGYHLNMVENFDNEELQEQFDLCSEEGQEFYQRADAYMKMRLTQMFILEALEGSESVLKVYPDLLDMYVKLSKRMNIMMAIHHANGLRRKLSVSTTQDGTAKSSRSLVSGSKITLTTEDSNSVAIDDDNESSNFGSSRISTGHHDDESLTSPKQQHFNKFLDSLPTPVDIQYILDQELPEPIIEEMEEKPSKSSSSSNNNNKKDRKNRKSFSISNLDDPLISLPTPMKKKKEKKEEKKPRKSGFLSIRRNTNSMLGFNSSSADLPSINSKKETEQEQPKFNQEDLLISSSLKLSESSIQLHNQRQNSLSPLQNSFSTNGAIQYELQNKKTSSVTLTEMTQAHKQQQQQQQQEVDDNLIRLALIDQWKLILIKIWIMVSSTYTRAQRYDEAYKAIQEADQITMGNNADVWHQIGTVIISQKQDKYQERALEAFKKALTLDENHVATHISLAAFYLDELNQPELAEQLLERITKGLGWNQSEAWYLLGRVYKEQRNLDDAKQSLMYAMKLSDINPIQQLDVFPRFV